MIFTKPAVLYLFILLCASSLCAEDVTVAFSPHKAPYVIGSDGRGLEIDIVREALAIEGHTLKVDYFDRNFLRKAIEFERTDASAGLLAKNDGLFYSDNYISFQNMILSRAEDKIHLGSLADLKGRRFSSWRNAHKILGEAFNLATENGTSPSYLEFDNQLIQSKMFWSHRIDLLVIDEFVFNWYRRILSETFITTGEIKSYPLLPEKTHFRMAFKRAKIRDAFNTGLAKLKQSGRYDELRDIYFWGQTASSPSPIYLHYYERPPYLIKGNNGVFGLTATPAADAFKASGVRFAWKATTADLQLELLKKNESKDCLVGWFTNSEREAFAKYTYPIYMDKPQVALFRKDNPIEVDTLDELFNDSKKVMLVKEAYSYGQYVDKLAIKKKPRRLISTIKQTEMLRELYDGKADYMLMAPEEVPQALAAAGLNDSEFNTQPLTDIPSGEQRYILCSKQVSDDVIHLLNTVIKTYPQ